MRFMHRDVLLEIYAALPVKFQDMVLPSRDPHSESSCFRIWSQRAGDSVKLDLSTVLLTEDL
jgi:hypothetical protein